MVKSLLLVVLGTLLVPLEASAPSPLSRYRDVALGEPLQLVVERLHLVAADVKVVHDRPSLVQELTWSPYRYVSGTTVIPDPLAALVLTFHMGQLARIVAIYDRERTQGLTDADLHESISSVYGLSTLRATPTQPSPANPASRRLAIGRWDDGETLLLLWREEYPSRVGLTITAIAEDRALQEAIAHGQRLDTEDAPKRELEKRAADAAAVRARDEKRRLENKALFKP